MRFGTLDFTPAADSPELLAAPTAAAIGAPDAADAAAALVSAIDPGLADTAAFCEHYEISMADGANCVIVQARRGERTWYAACLVRASRWRRTTPFTSARSDPRTRHAAYQVRSPRRACTMTQFAPSAIEIS